MLQPSPAPPLTFRARLRAAAAGRRALGLALALLVETLLLLILLSLSVEPPPGKPESEVTVVTLTPEVVSPAAPEPASPTPEQPQQPQSAQPPAPDQPRPPQPAEVPRLAEPAPEQPAPAPPPARVPIPAPAAPAAPAPPAPPAPSSLPVYGPPNKGGSSIVRDTERVGTMPNGEPLYAAAWYSKPSDKMLGDYLSTAQGPGWGLIACRTVPDYRVEDCVALDEYPRGSQINRSILAAAWEFRVRPPRVGGRSLVGTWVRIRIDYSITRR